MASPHTVIAEKYRLLRKLGEGGMGSVWLAEHLTLRSHVAIKLIDVGIVTNTEALARFLREAQSAAALRSPHVVQILDHGVDNGTPYIVMEVLEGESLADRLTRAGRLEPAVVARIITQVARAMSRAHEAGIVHRDLKPDNIFLVPNDDDEIAKVLDFGIAKSAAPGTAGASVSAATRTGSVLGTPYYMSPEQAEGAKSLDHRTDIWAMGVIAFECLLGRRPFDAETLASLLLVICARPIPIPSHCGPVPAGFDEWFSRACERDVSRRFSSAKEAAAELKRVCEGSLLGTAGASPHSVAPSGAGPTYSSRGPGPTAPGLTGQSVVGLSSSQLGATGRKRAGSGVAIALGLAAFAAVAAAGAFFAWSRFSAGRTPVTVASEAPSAMAAPGTPPRVAPPQVEPSVVAGQAPPSTSASAFAPASPTAMPAPTSPEPAAKRSAATAPLRDGATHHRPTAAAVAAPGLAAPEQPAKPAAPAKVNLGI